MKSIILMVILFFILFYKSYAETNPSDPPVKKDKEKPVAVIELEKKFPTPEASKKEEGVSKDGEERKAAEISLEMEGKNPEERTHKKENRLAKAGETLKDGFLIVLDKAKKVVGRCRPIDIIMW